MVVVRDARPDDGARVVPILEACKAAAGWAETNVGGRSTPDRSCPHVDLVAECDSRLVGWLAGDVVFGPDANGDIVPVQPYRGYVLNMAVHPEFRLRGIGRRLLDRAMELYRRQGCMAVELSVGSPSAARFYRACGGHLMRDEAHPTDGLTGSYEWVLVGGPAL